MSAYSLPLMFACPDVQGISMDILSFSSCVLYFLLYELLFDEIWPPILVPVDQHKGNNLRHSIDVLNT